MARRAGAVLRRGLCGAAGAGAVRQCRPGGQQLPRPQTFQPMRWACQPSQSSTPASSPCGISVSPLRRVLLKKLLRSDDTLIPQKLPASARLGAPTEPSGNLLTSCYCLFYLGVVLHRVQHPHGPARGLCCAGAFVVLLVLGQFGSVGLAGNSYPGPRRSSQCAGPASRARAARRQAALAGSAYRRCVEFC